MHCARPPIADRIRSSRQNKSRGSHESGTVLAMVFGKAHAHQMNPAMRTQWRDELGRNQSSNLDAPNWLWSSICRTGRQSRSSLSRALSQIRDRPRVSRMTICTGVLENYVLPGRLSEVRHTGCSGAAGASSGSVSPCVRSASRSPSSSSPHPVSARSKPPSLGCSGAASSRSPSSNSPNPVSARSKPPSFSSPSSSAKELAVPTRVQRQLIVGDHIVEFFAYGISRSIGQRST